MAEEAAQVVGEQVVQVARVAELVEPVVQVARVVELVVVEQ